ncbi:MAG: hypothetical protein K2J47_06470 [Ruminococcus sp.]|nr:hypothetical protein [Ruminococcus sp.]
MENITLLRQNQTVIIEQKRDKRNAVQKRVRHYDNTYVTTLSTESSVDTAEWTVRYFLESVLGYDYDNLQLVCDDMTGYWTFKFTTYQFVTAEYIEVSLNIEDIVIFCKKEKNNV